ncbi:DUF305 domain-containing protein [Nocardia farcinica]|uniref:DUF305 domain-containing protein n=1 Tax=Nocardia TaxID=1817 RepID=UPI0018951675|nr:MULTISPECIES: DUF305 domain-containing protein [Nocardia]MBF6289735.1 DUF305 domain-containing protein [Nocardia cyriacigeorgica]MBF6422227.1 DUF305 domain-containing protein [Nocardia farcinica]MBF6433883.1 DUF305 domain-containing protein [Nocardia farcinica]MBF6504951.1 DUF305 domain-containing protein [Nocardia farcinica]
MSLRSNLIRCLLPGVAVIALVAAGCGDDDSGKENTLSPTATGGPATSVTASPVPSSSYNDADVTFLQMMYSHHAQAIEMADLVPSRSQDREVIDLAATIKAAQQPEMTQIQALLESFGKPVPSGEGTMGQDMPGMMSPEEMSSLEGMSGPEFDRMWLEMMIGHHEGAVEMAQTEIATGANDQAKQLAQAVVSAQQTEIDQMKAMLAQR